MPPKKGAKKKAEEPPAPSEFDELTLPQLKHTLLDLREAVERNARERTQAQLDRDAVSDFLELSRREVKEVELALLAKEVDVATLLDNHVVEVKIYQQKIKHLEYEHSLALQAVSNDEAATLRSVEDTHLRREAALRAEKVALRTRMRELEEANAEAVAQLRASHEKNVSKMWQELSGNLESLRSKYETRLAQLRQDLRLRHKVEVHEVEERKNLHINQLMRAHSEAFGEMKKYYNDITRANLELIAQLKQQIAEAHEKQKANQRLMMEIAEENKRLSDPLQRAQAELATLNSDLKDAPKDRQSLAYARSRLAGLKSQFGGLERNLAALEERYRRVETERNELYTKFEATIRVAQSASEGRAADLEARLAAAEEALLARRMQVNEVISAAQLDPTVLGTIHARLDDVLESRDTMIKDLELSVAALAKAHNDAARVLDARMRELGLPPSETGARLLATGTGVGPAGLVSRPVVS